MLNPSKASIETSCESIWSIVGVQRDYARLDINRHTVRGRRELPRKRDHSQNRPHAPDTGKRDQSGQLLAVWKQSPEQDCCSPLEFRIAVSFVPQMDRWRLQQLCVCRTADHPESSGSCPFVNRSTFRVERPLGPRQARHPVDQPLRDHKLYN